MFFSTRGYKNPEDNFLSVIKKGVAPDGGLFLPEKIPIVSFEEMKYLKNYSYQDLLLFLFKKFNLGIDSLELKKIVNLAYSNFYSKKVCPLKKINNDFFLELFHGPTASFKDIALQITPKLFEKSIYENEKYCLLTATSGDTGIASIEGFKNIKNTKIFVIYPKNGVSEIQEKQMQSIENENVKVFSVNGDFDFCQNIVKKIFLDKELNKEIKKNHNTNFISGNSMNWGRLLPQIGYYFYSYIELLKNDEISLGESIEVCVPSGNFGNLMGSYISKKMGLPIAKFICASNENNILSEFLNTGIYDISNKKLVKTNSPSIDILKSSNIERLLYFLIEDASVVKDLFDNLEKKQKFSVSGEVLSKIKDCFIADFSTETEMKSIIKDYFERYNVLLDPHTAVATSVSSKYKKMYKRVIVSTAHYSKFPNIMYKVLGENKILHSKKELEFLDNLKSKTNTHESIKNIIDTETKNIKNLEGDYKIILNKILDYLKK
jgi:threonine synthase